MITILMATYNGARFVAAQIDSLLLQTEQGFVLHIQDDCSTDETYDILCDYAANYSEKIFVHKREENSGGAKWNFLDLMVTYQDDYVMLCDQDDVWLPNKIALTMQAMQAQELEHGVQTPLLVHTDTTIVDESLALINDSLNKTLDLRMQYGVISSQSFQNTVTGCTVMYNRALAQLIRIPQFCIEHDWWLGLLAISFGRKVYLPERTLLYRQHNANSIGAKKVLSFLYILDKIFHPSTVSKLLNETYQQAREMLSVYDDLLNVEQKTFLRRYAAIPKYRKLRRWVETQRLRAYKHGFVRRLAQFLYI